MINIDRVVVFVELKKPLVKKVITKGYSIEPINENKALLKLNIAKLNNNGLNFGTTPQENNQYLKELLSFLNLKFNSFKTIEYCVDIITEFKLSDNRFIIKTFDKILLLNNYKTGKLDYSRENGKELIKSNWNGIKGYKTSRTLKLYSKATEKKLITDKDIIRLELTFNERAISSNKIKNITDTKKAITELQNILYDWSCELKGKGNQYIKRNKELVNSLKKELENDI